MFDQVYDFFFGDQLRKHVVLISAFFLGQMLVIPLLGWLEPSQYVSLTVALAAVSVWPLRLLYDRRFTRQLDRTEEPIERNANNKMLMTEIIRHLERTLYDMYARKNNRLPTEQTTSNIILDFMNSRMLSRTFLEDYERLRGYLFHGIIPTSGQPPSVDNAKNLLNRLQSISYANEKTIHELSLYLERVMMQNFITLKQSGISDEEIGVMIVNLQSYLHLIMDMYNKETQKLVEEYKNTHS